MNNLLKFHNSREYADRMKPLNDKRFANNWFKKGSLQSKNFVVHGSGIYANLALSNDESFVVTGGYYQGNEIVLKLSIKQLFGIQSELMPTVLYSEAQTYNVNDNEDNDLRCVAISPDDRRMFSSSWSQRVFVHDIQTYGVLKVDSA